MLRFTDIWNVSLLESSAEIPGFLEDVYMSSLLDGADLPGAKLGLKAIAKEMYAAT